MAKGNCVLKYRVGSDEKEFVSLTEAASTVKDGLENMQTSLLQSARERLSNGITVGATYEEMKTALESDEASAYPGNGLYLVPWKCDATNEDKIKEECKATIRCYPLADNENMTEGQKCFYSGEDATHMALFGRAF